MRAVPSFLDLVGRRLALRQGSRELVEVERILSVARLLLALSSLIAIYFGPTEPARFATITLILFLAYFAHSIGLLVVVNARSHISHSLGWVIQICDLLWPAVVVLFTGNTSSPFVFYFSFALMGAAFRWGMREAVAATVVTVIIAAAQVIFFAPLPGKVDLNSNLNGFVARETYLIIFGILAGYLAESEKRRRTEALSTAQIVGKARVDAGMKASMQAVMQEVLMLFHAKALLLATTEKEAEHAYLWKMEAAEGNNFVFSGRQLSVPEESRYLFSMPAGWAGAAWESKVSSVLAIDENGERVREGNCLLSAAFSAQHPFRRLLLGRLSAMRDVQVSVYLLDPRLGGVMETQLRTLCDLMNSIAPAIYNVYLLRRLHSRAAAAERGRIARELHDGVVQSLHGIAFRLYALRTARGMDTVERNVELTDIQNLVQKETVNLRALIRQLEPLHFDPRQLLDFLSRMVEQFRYDTGISAKFVCDLGEVGLPPTTCRELAGIVREALANVLKHSGAENVLVRLNAENNDWLLTIEDDGRGFQFGGTLSHLQLRNSRVGPLVIKERVRAISGELTIESRPGQGARLEIRFPRQRELRLA